MGRSACISVGAFSLFRNAASSAHLDTHPTVIVSGVYHQLLAAASKSGSGGMNRVTRRALAESCRCVFRRTVGQRRKQLRDKPCRRREPSGIPARKGSEENRLHIMPI